MFVKEATKVHDLRHTAVCQPNSEKKGRRDVPAVWNMFLTKSINLKKGAKFGTNDVRLSASSTKELRSERVPSFLSVKDKLK